MGGLHRIDKRDLGHLEELGSGNFGVVYRASVTLDGVPRQMAYKELKPADGIRRKATDVVWGAQAIEDAVRFRDGLSAKERADLDAFTVWPQVLVTEGRYLRGYLMNEIPSEFFLRARTGPKMAELSWLSAKETSYRKLGIDSSIFTMQVRLYLLTQLAYAISWLHRRGRIYGDLSLGNGLFAANPARFLLIDCDATAVPDDPGRRQANTPGFFPPESGHTSLQTMATDVYKLSLCVVRALTTGRNATQITSADHLSELLPREVMSVLRRGLAPHPASRPSAKEIWQVLDAVLRRGFPPPWIVDLGIEGPETVLRGQDTLVRWDCIHADRIKITGPDGATYESREAKGSVAVRAGCSGRVSIKVINNNGFTRAVAGEIRVIELPTFELAMGVVPRPIVPRPPNLEGIQVPAIPLVARPSGPLWRFRDTAAHAIQPELAALFRAAQELLPGAGKGNSPDRGGRGFVEGFDDVMEAVRAAMREATPAIHEAYQRAGHPAANENHSTERDGHEHRA